MVFRPVLKENDKNIGIHMKAFNGILIDTGKCSMADLCSKSENEYRT